MSLCFERPKMVSPKFLVYYRRQEGQSLDREMHCDHKHVFEVMKPEHDNTSEQTIYISCHTLICVLGKIYLSKL